MNQLLPTAGAGTFHEPRWRTGSRFLFFIFIGLFALWLSGCTTTTTTTTTANSMSGQVQAPRGFFAKMADEFSERECSVGRFTCPFGFGSADEPCDCTDPDGVVRKGRTVK